MTQTGLSGQPTVAVRRVANSTSQRHVAGGMEENATTIREKIDWNSQIID
jgi:hypothetical protein